MRALHRAPAWYTWKPLLHLGVLLGAVALAGRVSWPLALVGVGVAAAQFVALYTFLHGASHGHLVAHKGLNDALGTALGMLLGTSFSAYRVCHMRHHRYLRAEEDTQEVVHICPHSRLASALLLLIASAVGAAAFIWGRVPMLGARIAPRTRVVGEMGLALVFHGFLWLLLLPSEFRLVLLGSIGLALVWGSAVDITYHQGLSLSGGLESSRSLDCDRFGLWFLNGENRHAEHHVYPGVPCPNLAALSAHVRPQLEAGGAVYESGYTKAFFKGLFLSPAFLPPPIGGVQHQPKDDESIH